jgi:DHA2 family multidrug resistance protein
VTDYLSKVFSFRRYIIGNTILFALFHGLRFRPRSAVNDRDAWLAGVRRWRPHSYGLTMVLTCCRSWQPIDLRAALAVTFAPAIGPTIGGYLTENYGWQTIFFVNVVPTAVMVTTLYFTLERQPMQLNLLREGDWLGIATMAIGLSALQAVLEEGNKDDWFGSPFILRYRGGSVPFGLRRHRAQRPQAASESAPSQEP